MNKNQLMEIAGWRRVGWNSPEHKLKNFIQHGYWIKNENFFGHLMDDVTAYTSVFKKHYFREKPFPFDNWNDVFKLIKKINHINNEELKQSLYKAEMGDVLKLIIKLYESESTI